MPDQGKRAWGLVLLEPSLQRWRFQESVHPSREAPEPRSDIASYTLRKAELGQDSISYSSPYSFALDKYMIHISKGWEKDGHQEVCLEKPLPAVSDSCLASSQAVQERATTSKEPQLPAASDDGVFSSWGIELHPREESEHPCHVQWDGGSEAAVLGVFLICE